MVHGPYQVIAPFSPWHRQNVFIEVEAGYLKAIEPTQAPMQAHLIPGGVDLLAWTNWPADPRAETLTALGNRLYQAGYTEAIVASPLGWSDPEMFAVLLAEAQSAPVSLYLLASFWEKDQIAAVESLRGAGAWGWTLPLTTPIPWKGLLESLGYLRYLGGPVFILPFWEALANEMGVPQISLLSLSGWRGTPPMAETLAIRLLAEIHRHSGGSLYVGPITTRHGFETVNMENITYFTAFPYLFFCADRLLSYDPTWKVHPSLQEPTDQIALWEAVAKGQLSLIASYHELIPSEEKEHPWAEARPGMATLPEGPALFFSLAERMGLSLEQAVTAWAISPRQKLGLPLPALTVGAPLKYVILQPLSQHSSWHGMALSYALRPLTPLSPSIPQSLS